MWWEACLSPLVMLSVLFTVRTERRRSVSITDTRIERMSIMSLITRKMRTAMRKNDKRTGMNNMKAKDDSQS